MKVICITGLPGSGKTTAQIALKDNLSNVGIVEGDKILAQDNYAIALPILEQVYGIEGMTFRDVAAGLGTATDEQRPGLIEKAKRFMDILSVQLDEKMREQIEQFRQEGKNNVVVEYVGLVDSFLANEKIGHPSVWAMADERILIDTDEAKRKENLEKRENNNTSINSDNAVLRGRQIAHKYVVHVENIKSVFNAMKENGERGAIHNNYDEQYYKDVMGVCSGIIETDKLSNPQHYVKKLSAMLNDEQKQNLISQFGEKAEQLTDHEKLQILEGLAMVVQQQAPQSQGGPEDDR